MSEENRNRAIRWMEENWNQRREGVVDELMHPDCVGRMEGGEVKGRDGWRQARDQLLASFPDLRMIVEQTVVEGDTVVLRWRVVGTHDGDALGAADRSRDRTARRARAPRLCRSRRTLARGLHR